MKRIILAAAMLAAAPFAIAQAEAPKADAPKVDVPKPNCGTPPELPGNTMMQDQAVRKRFENDVKKYTECIKAYSAEREAAIKANREQANQVINEYNTWQQAIMEEQKKRRGGGETTGAGDRVNKNY